MKNGVSQKPADLVAERTQQLYLEQEQSIARHADFIISRLMVFQWVFALVLTIWVSPYTWSGIQSQVHVHIWAALLLGGLVTSVPVFLGFTRPGETATRQSIAVGQMLMSALLIHLTGGRIETHFHVFGSLAILAFYRDLRVMFTATIVVVIDHVVRGIYWPESAFGVMTPSFLRALEHGGWVIFEVSFLMLSIRKSHSEMRLVAERQAKLEALKEGITQTVQEQTQELANSLSLLRATLESTADGIFVTDEKNHVVSFNDHFVRMWGISDTVTVMEDPQKLQAIFLSQLKDPAAAVARMEELRLRPESDSFEVLEFKDGRIFERYSKPQGISERSVGRVWSCRDVTERRHAEITSLAFSKLGQSLASASTPQEAAQKIVDIADELFSWDSCAFYLYFEKTGEINWLLHVDTLDNGRVNVLSPEQIKEDIRPSVIDCRVIKNGAELILKEGPLTFEAGAIPFGNTSRPSASTMRVPVRAGLQP